MFFEEVTKRIDRGRCKDKQANLIQQLGWIGLL